MSLYRHHLPPLAGTALAAFLAILPGTFAATALHVELTDAQRRRLMNAYLHLTPWPDTTSALRRLKESNVRIVTLANFIPAMLRSNADNAGLSAFFDVLISTDANRTYKPDPRAYQLGVDYLHLAKEDIVFAGSADGMQRARSCLAIRRCGSTDSTSRSSSSVSVRTVR